MRVAAAMTTIQRNSVLWWLSIAIHINVTIAHASLVNYTLLLQLLLLKYVSIVDVDGRSTKKKSHSHPCNWTWKLSAFFRSIFDRIPFIFRSFSSSDFSYLSNFINACSVFDMWMSCWLQWRAHKENDDHQTISITVKICCGKHWAQKKRKNGKKCEKKKAEAIDGEPALDYNNYN